MPARTQESFEYVVVGGGSGGCVVAARLRESGAHVLLLEAGGPDDHTDIPIPGFWWRLQGSTADWAYETEPQAHLDGRRVSWPRGKTLGGSSSINAMIYVRGHPADYDGWAAAGNQGWSYDDVLPYFRRAEDFEDGANSYHGAGGPLHVENRRYTHEITDAITAGFRELGFPANDDFNGPTMEGVGRYHVTQKNGARHSAAAAYLHPALAAPGPGQLEARTGAHVTRILFDGLRALGVEYSSEAGSPPDHGRARRHSGGGRHHQPPSADAFGSGGAGHAGSSRRNGPPYLARRGKESSGSPFSASQVQDGLFRFGRSHQ